MKKILLSGVFALVALCAAAQVTVWQTYYNTIDYDYSTGKATYDTISVAFNQYRLSDFDSIRFDNNNHLYFMKDGSPLSVVSGYNDQSIYGTTAFKTEMVDSLVWHPYPVVSAPRYDDTIRVEIDYLDATKNTFLMALDLDPYYTTDEVTVTSSDTSVVKVGDMRRHYIPSWPGTANFPFRYDMTVLQPGQAVITEHVGHITNRIVVLVDRVAEYYYQDPDLLYDAIYNRMTRTGKIAPDGRSDIQGIDEGASSFFRQMHQLNELSADHLWWIWGDIGIDDVRKDKWKADNQMIYGLYARLLFNVDLCNQYLSMTGTPADKRAEVRTMRAFYYYYLLDMFGNVPIITDFPVTSAPAQSTRAQVYQFVEQELLACVNQLPAMPADGTHGSVYHVDKVAAQLLLARLYLNSQVYTGTPNYDAAAQYAYAVISDNHYSLATSYRHLFMGDNAQGNGNTAISELMLAARCDGAEYASWGGSKYLISSMYDGYYMPSSGTNEGWQCIRSKKKLINLFFSDSEASSVAASNTAAAAGDDRALFCSSSNGKSWSCKSSTSSGFYDCWAVIKFSNVGASSSFVPSSAAWPDMAIPMLRKAEAYLIYAEAVLRGAQMQNGYTALAAVNALRTRANAQLLTSITLDEILNEWGREFFAEGRRRIDLIRFGKFGGQSAYTWEGKSGATTFTANHNIFPIPAKVLESQPSMVQNPGY